MGEPLMALKNHKTEFIMSFLGSLVFIIGDKGKA